jgi:lysophospholipase L1-like esterase
MDSILVNGDSLSWGIIPNTRKRLQFEQRWPGVLERELAKGERRVRVLEDCLNGRRTVWDDPFKPGRNGLQGFEQKLEIHSPLLLLILVLGTNDFQSTHVNSAALSAQGIAALVRAARRAPIEPGMPVPKVLVVAPPPILTPKGSVAAKFEGAEVRARGVAAAYGEVANELGCFFFDAGSVISTSQADGVHLDADQHRILGLELAKQVGPLLGQSDPPIA